MAVRCKDCREQLPEGHQGPCPNCGSRNRIAGISGSFPGVSFDVGKTKVWLSQTTAPDWLADSRAEAERGQELAAELDQEHSKEVQQALVRSLHREIVFAVCFAEAFLLEYLRNYVFIHREGKGHREALVAFVERKRDDRDIPRWKVVLAALFPFIEREKDDRGIPIWERLGIRRRWKWAVKTLQEEGKLRDEPAFEGQAWQQFQEELAPFRNGIVHAKISRPTRGGTEEIAEPTPASLFDRGPGWATSVVVELGWNLHALNPRNLDAPDYLA